MPFAVTFNVCLAALVPTQKPLPTIKFGFPASVQAVISLHEFEAGKLVNVIDELAGIPVGAYQ